jgi:serine/threonine-protein kinase RsbW
VTKNRHLTIKNQLLELTRLQTTLEDFFAQHDLSAEVAGEMMLVSEELLVNTISYGYQDELEHAIDIKLSIQGDCFSMTLIDDGQAFNPLEQQAPTMGQPAAEVAIGGLGIPLIRALSDQQHYQHSNGQNIFIFTKVLLTTL